MNVQELVDKNRAASFPVGIPDASSGLQGTIAQPVTGPSLNQFSAITAALQALQASMTTMLPQSESAQENEPSVDNQATDSSADWFNVLGLTAEWFVDSIRSNLASAATVKMDYCTYSIQVS